MNLSKQVESLILQMTVFAKEHKHEFVTPEHLLYVMLSDKDFSAAFKNCGGNIEALKNDLENYLEKELTETEEGLPKLSTQMEQLLSAAESRAIACEKFVVELPHIVSSFSILEDSYAVYFIAKQEIEIVDLLYELCELIDADTYSFGNFDDFEDDEPFTFSTEGFGMENTKWEDYVTCMNDEVEEYTPLIGREQEIERTMQVLCRKEKNNPLHIGEAGVGKTAITKGLVQRIAAGNVPAQLKNTKVYSLDIGTLLAGTQYRGDFEKRFKKVMDGLSKEERPIVYIDEIHNIVGVGAVNGGSLDLSNLLKPYLTDGSIRFIGATTYEEYNKHFAKSKSLLRRFQNIDVKEPSIEETIGILNGLKKSYEKYHGVKYNKGVIEHAVILSDKYVNERYLPDKAIDLIDEAGAYRCLHPLEQKTQSIDKKLIEDILAKTCNIPKQTVESDEMDKLANLEISLKKEIFGQDEAVNEVVNAIKLARCGLNEENKTIANLLFVGPTGVGKTEIARCLAKNLGIELVRFDMSEYAEKHAVAKLIGAPAGYVGYEEGGLLTDAIRKTPHCVLLLDEIEKAHSDIYNVLLQLMDYATLTDNQGKKADFRNVILIMTSNAGAKFIGKSQIGFESIPAGAVVVDEELKRIFSPEFRNRLTKIINFRFVDEKMAMRIIDKQLNLFIAKLSRKNIHVAVDESVRTYLKENGINSESGARKISHLIQTEIKPVFVDLMLFGALKKGGECRLVYEKGKFCCKILHRMSHRQKVKG